MKFWEIVTNWEHNAVTQFVWGFFQIFYTFESFFDKNVTLANSLYLVKVLH